MNKNTQTKIIIGIVVLVVIILAAIALGGKKEMGPAERAAQQVESGEPIAPEAAVTGDTEIRTQTISETGVYAAECLLQGAGTMIGRVHVKKNEDPAKQDKISIKNMNTGKSVDVDMSKATCSFTPVAE